MIEIPQEERHCVFLAQSTKQTNKPPCKNARNYFMIEIPQEERDCVFLAQPTNQPNKQTSM